MLTLLPGPDYVPNNNFSQVLTRTQLTGTAKTHVHIKEPKESGQELQKFIPPKLELELLIYPVHIPGGSCVPLVSKKKRKN
jgi:hypothetical protein